MAGSFSGIGTVAWGWPGSCSEGCSCPGGSDGGISTGSSGLGGSAGGATGGSPGSGGSCGGISGFSPGTGSSVGGVSSVSSCGVGGYSGGGGGAGGLAGFSGSCWDKCSPAIHKRLNICAPALAMELLNIGIVVNQVNIDMLFYCGSRVFTGYKDKFGKIYNAILHFKNDGSLRTKYLSVTNQANPGKLI